MCIYNAQLCNYVCFESAPNYPAIHVGGLEDSEESSESAEPEELEEFEEPDEPNCAA